MVQTFPRSANRLPLRLAAGGVVAAGLLAGGVWYYFSPAYTDIGYRPDQPVAFSHRLHAGELEIDCLYCHVTVDRSPVAVVPPTQICMNCHRVVKRDSPALAAIRESSTSGRPIRWVRVYDLPGFTYFDHRPHLRAGVGCATCHGRIDQMEVVTQVASLSMSWCVDCHRDPDLHLRPDHEVTTMDWRPAEDQLQVAARVKAGKHLRPPLDCTGCHR